MSGFLNIRDAVRDFFRKFDEIITPVFRFVLAYIMFTCLEKMYGYEPLFGKQVVVLLLSVICALVSDKVAVLVGCIVLLLDTLAVSKEVGLLFLVIVIVMYCSYIRLFPDTAWVLVFVPIMYYMGIPYAIPMVIMMFIGMAGVIPVAFGAVIYYLSVYLKGAAAEIALLPKNNDFQIYKYMLEEFKNNKEIILHIIVFAVAIIVGTIVYRLAVDYAWYIGIAVCAVMSIISFIACAGKVGVSVNIGTVFIGTLLGLVIAFVLQLFKSVVDYSRKEVVQYEDDEYFYYVKAVPKYNKANGAATLSKKVRKHKKAVSEEETEENVQDNIRNDVEENNHSAFANVMADADGEEPTRPINEFE